MSEWQEVTLGTVSQEISYGYTESAAAQPIGPKFLRITDIANGRLTWDSVPYCKINDDDFKKYQLLAGDIVIARTGATTGANYLVKRSDPQNVVYASYLIRYRMNKAIAEPAFVGFCLKSPAWNAFIEGSVGGSAQPGANAKLLANFEFLLPPLDEQRAIASVLSSLDNKIDLLHRQNATLEALAEAFFRQCFLNETTEPSETKPVSFFGQVICGKTPSKGNTSYFGGSVPFIKIPDMHGKVFVGRTDDSLTEEGKKSQLNKTIPPLSICVSCIATVGLVSMNIYQAQTNQQINSIIPKQDHYRYFLFQSMRLMKDDLDILASGGTATANLNTGDFSKIELGYSGEELLKKFHDQVSPYYEKILFNTHQIGLLERYRENLLPKLMSGEVRVRY